MREWIDRGHFTSGIDANSADRPFTESERAFLEQIREWGKKIVFIVNKIDILTRREERDEQKAGDRENGLPGLSGDALMTAC